MKGQVTLLGLIHTDVCGPLSTSARGGYSYFVIFTDDFSRYGYVYLMRHKSETFEKFKDFKNEVQNQLGKSIKVIRSDRGGGYLSLEDDFYTFAKLVLHFILKLFELFKGFRFVSH